MKTKHVVFFNIAFALFAFSPTSSHAYYTTHQTVFKINDQTALFAIEYVFGVQKSDIYMPIAAVRGLPWKSHKEAVGYSLLEDGRTRTDNGTASGIVLSYAPIEDGMYKITRGSNARMTLVVLLATTKEMAEMDYALQVDQLPYYKDVGGSSPQTLQLNPSELKSYITKEVELNSANQVHKATSTSTTND